MTSWRVSSGLGRALLFPILLLALSLTWTSAIAKPHGAYRLALVPILGVTMDGQHAGTVVYVELGFKKRSDEGGLTVEFSQGPGQFSPLSRAAATQGIYRAAKALGLHTDSWSVALKVPHHDVTIYGGSLSAMIGLSVAAMANGDELRTDRVMTGMITQDGQIGAVGAVPDKVEAAEDAHIRHVVVPDERDPADSDWRTPFLMHVSPVGSVEQAYEILIKPRPPAQAAPESSLRHGSETVSSAPRS